MKYAMPSPVRLAVFLVVIVLASCGRKEGPDRPQAESAATETFKPVAIVEPSAGPRWFELSASGPVAIRGPAEASLAPFEPWPLARRIVGFVVRDGLIAAGSNRDGFVGIVARKDGVAAIYRAADSDVCGPYSIASVFSLDGAPAALLYRDRFFIEPEVEPATVNVVTLVAGNPRPVKAELGALAAYGGKEGWDVESIERSADGDWHFRAVPAAAGGGGETAYLVSGTLQDAALRSTAAAFRSARDPLPLEDAEPVLRRALADAASLAGGGNVAVATALSPGQASVAYYLLSESGTSAATAALAKDVGRAWACSDGARAYVALADGRLTAALGREGPVLRSRLPVLPEGYAYTGLASTGNLLVAAWEEQDGWAVGAAGFVILPSEVKVAGGY